MTQPTGRRTLCVLVLLASLSLAFPPAGAAAKRGTATDVLELPMGGELYLMGATTMMVYDEAQKDTFSYPCTPGLAVVGRDINVRLSFGGEAVLSAIHCTGSFKLYGREDGILKLDSAGSTALSVESGVASIVNGTLYAAGEESGVRVTDGALTVEGQACVEAMGNTGPGIDVTGRLAVSQSARVNGTGERDAGIRAGEIRVPGGSLRGTGANAGVLSDSDITVEKGTLYGEGNGMGVSAPSGEISIVSGTLCGQSSSGQAVSARRIQVSGVLEEFHTKPETVEGDAYMLPQGTGNIGSCDNYSWGLPEGDGAVEAAPEGIRATASSRGTTALTALRETDRSGEPVALAAGGSHRLNLQVRLIAGESTPPPDGGEENGEGEEDNDPNDKEEDEEAGDENEGGEEEDAGGHEGGQGGGQGGGVSPGDSGGSGTDEQDGDEPPGESGSGGTEIPPGTQEPGGDDNGEETGGDDKQTGTSAQQTARLQYNAKSSGSTHMMRADSDPPRDTEVEPVAGMLYGKSVESGSGGNMVILSGIDPGELPATGYRIWRTIWPVLAGRWGSVLLCISMALLCRGSRGSAGNRGDGRSEGAGLLKQPADQ